MPSRVETIPVTLAHPWARPSTRHQGDPGYCSKLWDRAHTVPWSSSPLPGTHPACRTQAQDHPCPLPQWQPPAQWNVAWSPKWTEELAHPAHIGHATGGSCPACRGSGSAHTGAERADQAAWAALHSARPAGLERARKNPVWGPALAPPASGWAPPPAAAPLSSRQPRRPTATGKTRVGPRPLLRLLRTPQALSGLSRQCLVGVQDALGV